MRKYAFIMCLLLLACRTFASELTYTNKQAVSTLGVLSTVKVSDDFISLFNPSLDYQNSFTDKTVNGRIKLYFHDQNHKQLSTGSWYVKVTFNYRCITSNGSFTAVQSGTLKIKGDYTSGVNTMTDLDVLDISKALPGVDVRAIQVYNFHVTKSGMTSIPSDIILEPEIRVERYFKLDPFVTTPLTISHLYVEDRGVTGSPETPASTTTNRIELYWPYYPGAEEYDLEYYFVSEEVDNFSTYTAADIPDDHYTRVTLQDNHYYMNMVYERGKVFYRVRPVGRFGPELTDRLEGQWSSDALDYYTSADATNGRNFIAIHVNTTELTAGSPVVTDKVKNWTYQSSFAENGKKKEVLSLFDGAGRNRETVTLSNTEDVALAAESFYDYEGRAVISALPSPSGDHSNVLRYYGNLNRNDAVIGTHNGLMLRQDYDVVATEFDCYPQDLQFSTTEGSSKYYSGSNNDKEGFNAYIPDGLKYTYARTRYGRDGQVEEQSGVGDAHLINSAHSTKFFHASPLQEKLDRLLGSHAGFAAHYTLEAVTDANGQTAMTYKNLKGQVVATSLTGGNPSAMKMLESNSGTAEDFTASFDSDDHYDSSDPAYTINKTFFAEADGTYTFTYILDPATYTAFCDKPGGDCTYDVEFGIYDRCDAPLSENEGATISSGSIHADGVLFSTTPYTFSVSGAPHTITFTVDLTAGTYTIYKKTTLNAAALATEADAFRQYLLDHPDNSCVQAINIDPIYNCYDDCADFCAQLGLEDCDCGTASDLSGQCDDLLSNLAADMTPGGQYYDGISHDNGWLIAMENDYVNTINAYNLACSGSSSTNFWTAFNSANGTSAASWSDVTTWINTNLASDPDFIYSVLFPIAGYSSCTLTTTTVSIVKLHPEFCLYEKCEALSASSQFDMDLMLAAYNGTADVTYTSTSTAVYDVAIVDPLTTNNVYPGTTSISLAHMLGTYTVNWPSQDFEAWLNAGLYENGQTNDLWALAVSNATADLGTTPTTDQSWQYFVGLYNSKKQDYIDANFGFCDYLCDNSFPPDELADACTGTRLVSTPVGDKAVVTLGYYINVPMPSVHLTDGGATDPDLVELEHEGAGYDPTCENYIDINLCDINMCGNCVDGFESENMECNTTGMECLHEIRLRIGGVDISGDLYGTLPDCDFSSITDVADFFKTVIDADHSSPEWNVTVVDDCNIRIWRPGTSYTGKAVMIGQASSFNSVGWPVQGYCYYPIGTIQEECNPIPDQSCFCSDLFNNYDYLYEQDPLHTELPGHEQTIVSALFDDMSDRYAGMGINIGADTLEAWFDNCLATGQENSVDPEGFSATVPESLLYDCQTPGCEDDPEPAAIADYYESEEYLALVENMVQQFIAHYKTDCFHHVNDGGDFDEHYQLSGKDFEYHYTVYYYDQAGNLTTTVPPRGVKLLEAGMMTMVAQNRLHPTDVTYPFVNPAHTLATLYQYNSYNQLLQQNVPDANDVMDIVSQNPQSPASGTDVFGLIQMLDANNGYAITTLGGVYHTTNGGGLWSSTSPCSTLVMQKLKIFNDDNWLAIETSTHKVTYKNASCWHNASTATGYTDFALADGGLAYAISPTAIMAVTLSNIDDPSAFTATGSTLCTLATSYNKIAYDGDHILYLMSTTTGNMAAVDLSLGTPAVVATTTLSSITPRTFMALNPHMILVGGTSGTSPRIGYLYLNYDPSTTTYSFSSYTASTLNHTSPVSTGNINAFDYGSTGMLYTVGNSLFMSSSDYGFTWNDVAATGITSGLVVGGVNTFNGSVYVAGANYINTLSTNTYDHKFFYDNLGRIKASQDSRQHGYAQPAYSYSSYDALGRVTEAGQTQSDGSFTLDDPTDAELKDATWPDNWITVSGVRKEVTYTLYDNPNTDTDVEDNFESGSQENLRKRVSSAWFKDDASDADYKYASHYSYDIHGNVNEFVQEIKALDPMGSRFKKMDYDYDLISGNVNSVVYQKDQGDQFMHRYLYDADNRLKLAETSRDGIIWDKDGKYFYYLHGPLARKEIGQYKVQGMDYAYTLHGWLKGVNANVLDQQTEMGKDAYNSAGTGSGYYYSTNLDLHRYVATDAFGYSLGYYNGTNDDYTAITSGTGMGNSFLTDAETYIGGNNLFNGNIRNTGFALMDATESELALRGTNYYYDQLNRLADATSKTFTASGNSYASGTTCLGENLTYDANGNIQSYKKYDDSNAQFDQLGYIYDAVTNKLSWVTENGALDGVQTNDIDNGQSANNYTYDASGHLIGDVQENISAISWSARDKVTKVDKSTGSDMFFEYDAMNHRVLKREKVSTSQDSWKDTWYVMDATGNVMGIYSNEYSTIATNTYEQTFKLKELDIYGGERLGMKDQEVTLFKEDFTCSSFNGDGTFNSPSVTTTYTLADSSYHLDRRTLQEKKYELTNHLGNVVAVITAYKIPVPVSSPTDLTVTYYRPDVVSYSDYYGFGMAMPGRNGNSGDYRYGFNGQEKDDEIQGAGNTYTAEFWEYDPRIGRRWNLDPVDQISISNYAAFGNNPILNTDPLGNDPGDYYSKSGKKLGSDDKADDKTYLTSQEIVDSNTKNGVTNWSGVTSASGTVELGVSSATLGKFAETIKNESSGDKQESYALASTMVNLAKYKGKDLLNVISAPNQVYGYSGKSDFSNAEYGLEAAINALSGGTDYSNGAIRWDGFDLAGRGFSHVKARTYGIEVSKEDLDAFKAFWTDSKLKAASGGSFTSFSTNFTTGIHLATSGLNKGRCLLQSTAVHGGTLFWGANKVANVKDYANAGMVTRIPLFNWLPVYEFYMVPFKNINEGYKNWKGL